MSCINRSSRPMSNEVLIALIGVLGSVLVALLSRRRAKSGTPAQPQIVVVPVTVVVRDSVTLRSDAKRQVTRRTHGRVRKSAVTAADASSGRPAGRAELEGTKERN